LEILNGTIGRVRPPAKRLSAAFFLPADPAVSKLGTDGCPHRLDTDRRLRDIEGNKMVLI
jgi:hypothetical protein